MGLTIDQVLQQGIAVHKAGKLQEAERLYRSILTEQPKHSDANHNLGVLAVSIGKNEEALPFFKIALKSNPKQGQFWLSYMDALINLDRLDDAREILKQAVASGLKGDKVDKLKIQLNDQVITTPPTGRTSNPSQQQLDYLASLYYQGNLKEALISAETLTIEFPNNPNLLNFIGIIYKALGKYNKAISKYKAAVELKPDYAEAQNNLGNALCDLGKHEKAISCYNKAIELKVDYTEAYYNLGNTLNELKRYEEAIIVLNKSIELKPDFPEAYNNLGNALNELDRYEEAIIVLNTSIELKPDFSEAYNNLGIALNELGRHEEAIVCLKKALELKPNFAEALNNIGTTLTNLQNYQEAIIALNKAIELKPDFPEAYNNLGNALNELGRHEEAIISLKKLLELKSNFSQAYFNMGNALIGLERYEEAVTYLDLANSQIAKAKILECLYKDGNYIKFKERLDSLVESEKLNIRVAAVSAFVAHQLKQEDPYPFCKDPLDYFHIGSLHEHTDNVVEFTKKVISEANQEEPVWQPGFKTTVNGFQTKDTIFQAGQNCARLKKIIMEEINSYRLKFSSNDCLFIKSWPTKYALQGWYVRLIQNGHQTSHIHADGWMSGVVYLKTVKPRLTNEGAIELSLHGYDLPILDQNYPKRVYLPQIGDIVLFPSSLFHKTIPFTESTDRCVIAFDLCALEH